jgi:ABC-type sulfate/molybdate transport systems ATPase subunit
MSVEIHCRDVTHRLGKRAVLENVDWHVPAGQLAGLVGNSGAGKTTLLRLIAGLDVATAGAVNLHQTGRPYSGPIGMVFQSLGLWPHLTVHQHLTSVMGGERSTRALRAAALLDEVQLDREYSSRYPTQLSGGEAQRLALARALATEPGLLLLDEPFAQLDATLRGGLLRTIKRIATSRRLTLVCVTHSWSDVAELCDQVAVLSDGRLVRQGSVRDVYFHPSTARVAELTGPVVRIERRLLDRRLIAPSAEQTSCGSDAGAEARLVRPQELAITPASGPTAWRVEACEPSGIGWRLSLLCQGEAIELPSGAPHPVGSHVSVVLVGPNSQSTCPAGLQNTRPINE